MNGHVLVVLVGWSTTTTTTDVIESGRSVMYGCRGVDKSSPSIVSIREWMEVFKLEEKGRGHKSEQWGEEEIWRRRCWAKERRAEVSLSLWLIVNHHHHNSHVQSIGRASQLREVLAREGGWHGKWHVSLLLLRWWIGYWVVAVLNTAEKKKKTTKVFYDCHIQHKKK